MFKDSSIYEDQQDAEIELDSIEHRHTKENSISWSMFKPNRIHDLHEKIKRLSKSKTQSSST